MNAAEKLNAGLDVQVEGVTTGLTVTVPGISNDKEGVCYLTADDLQLTSSHSEKRRPNQITTDSCENMDGLRDGEKTH